ncbi:hypothetical protein ACFE04_022901 [Oxalis oulophora]
MNSMNEENLSDLLEAQVRVYADCFSYIKPMSIKCALELGIPEIIHNHGQPMTLSELVSALPINSERSPCIGRLMRLLIHFGVFGQQKITIKNPEQVLEDGYVLTDTSRLLLEENPFSLRPFFMLHLDRYLIEPWQQLGTWFKNDDHPTPYYTAHGKTLFDVEPRMNKVFNEGMTSDSRFLSSVTISKCRSVFEGLKTFVDVGGGTGTFARAIAQAFPHLECMVFELPHVIADLQDDTIKFVEGDMFKAVPPADAILLKMILHDWNDEECVQILKQCREAITSDKENCGKVIIIDMVIRNGVASEDIKGLYELQLFYDMEMMTVTKGKERSEKEWAKLFLDAGFSDYKIHPILGARSFIEVYP